VTGLGWIFNRAPKIEELRVIPFGTRPAYGEFFLVWDGEMVDIGFFEILPGTVNPQETGNGFWRPPDVLAWQPLPLPPDNRTE